MFPVFLFKILKSYFYLLNSHYKMGACQWRAHTHTESYWRFLFLNVSYLSLILYLYSACYYIWCTLALGRILWYFGFGTKNLNLVPQGLWSVLIVLSYHPCSLFNIFLLLCVLVPQGLWFILIVLSYHPCSLFNIFLLLSVAAWNWYSSSSYWTCVLFVAL